MFDPKVIPRTTGYAVASVIEPNKRPFRSSPAGLVHSEDGHKIFFRVTEMHLPLAFVDPVRSPRNRELALCQTPERFIRVFLPSEAVTVKTANRVGVEV